MPLNWRPIRSWAASRPFLLRTVDQLGRSRGRLRLLDDLRPTVPAPLRPDLSRWHARDLAAVWIGHATVLLRIGGMTILTDPVFSTRVGVGLGLLTAGPRRLVAPALALSQLPPVDLLLISHAHFDHLDRPSLARLPKRTPVITARHTADLVRDLGFRRVAELDWGESRTLGPLRVTAREAAHWGARVLHDRHRGFNAYVIESKAGPAGPARRVLYGGDTAYHNGFADLGAAGGVDLAVMGIGGYDPYIASHANPEQTWAMAEQAGARRVLPMHHRTFVLSFEPPEEPIGRLLDTAGSEAARVVVREVGGQWAPG